MVGARRWRRPEGPANALNQYGTVGTGTLTYDVNGNLTGDGTTSYRYDVQNRLVGVTRGTTVIAYAYDAEGRQAMRTVGANTTRYLHGLGQEIAEYSGAAPGTLARRHVPGPGLDEPLATVTGNAASRARRYYHADAQGSIVARTDDTGAAPAAAERYTYTPWGQVGTGTGTSQDGFRWLGRRLESQIGLYDMRARTYLPWMGRFLQPDPIGTTGGINLYAYAQNTPLNRTDTSGLISVGSVAGSVASLQGKGGASFGLVVPAQAALGLCFAGPLGCAAGASITAGQLILGGTALGAAGALVLNNQNQDERPAAPPPTEHGEQRQAEARTDPHRDVGDPNRVLNQGRRYTDAETGNTIYVDGDRVVVTNPNGERVSQFRNTRRNTQERVRDGRWIPE